MFRRTAVLSFLVAALAAGLPAAAQAQGPAEVTCIFDGLSGKLDDGHGHGIQNAQFDASIDIERGSYNFSTGGGVATLEAICGGEIGGIGFVGLNAEITSSGFYDNKLCGTGWAHDLDGNSTSISFTSASVPPLLQARAFSLTNIGYEIDFDAGNGPLYIGPDGGIPLSGLSEFFPADSHAPSHGADGVASGPTPSPFSSMHQNIDSDWIGDGEVHITPRAPDNCLNAAAESDGFNDTDEFLVSGSFTMERDLP
jgi:hypothetical protein